MFLQVLFKTQIKYVSLRVRFFPFADDLRDWWHLDDLAQEPVHSWKLKYKTGK